MPKVIDEQANGWYDDGSESGAIRTRLLRGNLVPVPFRGSQYYAELVGGATAAYATTAVYTNPDGSGTGINVSVPTGLTQSARIYLPFYGRAFGVRWRRDSAVTPASISVVVDGEAVRVDTASLALPVLEGISNTAFVDMEARALTHDDLPSYGPHIAEIMVASDPSVVQAITLYGYLADERAGYRALPRLPFIGTTGTLTTTQTEVPTNRGATLSYRSVRQIIYANTTAGAVTVTVQNNTTTMWSKSVPANDTVTLDFGAGGVGQSANLKHAAGANSSVNYTVIGEY